WTAPAARRGRRSSRYRALCPWGAGIRDWGFGIGRSWMAGSVTVAGGASLLRITNHESRIPALPDVDDSLGGLVLGRDHLRVGLEVALRGDHVDQLFGQVDGRGLERTGLDAAEVRRVRGAAARGAGGVGRGPH